MSYKVDEILTMLDQVLMKLDNIERHLNIRKLPQKTVDKPKLTVVQSESNVVEFNKDE